MILYSLQLHLYLKYHLLNRLYHLRRHLFLMICLLMQLYEIDLKQHFHVQIQESLNSPYFQRFRIRNQAHHHLHPTRFQRSIVHISTYWLVEPKSHELLLNLEHIPKDHLPLSFHQIRRASVHHDDYDQQNLRKMQQNPVSQCDVSLLLHLFYHDAHL